MIEKLEQTVRGFDDKPAMPTAIEFFNKINELVDAVNELQTKVNKLAQNINFTQPEVKENVQDKFAEQRKWIGKLCWVWEDDDDERTFAKLKEIIEDDDDRPFKCVMRWKHCEPVKPDDDIIYKGGNNE